MTTDNQEQNVLYPKGSEWRKWDLHVHSPKTYGGSYDDFINNINNSEAEVIGINDYSTIEGYEEIISKYRDKVKKILFPTIEFRMNNILLDKDDVRLKKGTRFNFHIIFDNDPNLIPRIKTWLNSLECLNEKGESDRIGNIKILDEKLSLNYFSVVGSIEKDDYLKNRCLVWLPYDEYGGIDDINPEQDKYFKLGLINKAHIIGSSNTKQINFFVWKSDKYKEEEIKKWLNNRKIPCVKGSDAHKINYPFGKLKDENSQPIDKYCWIKADPTFEGLKQIIYEPEERVYIGEEPPQKIEKDKIIKSLTISNSNRWFEDNKPIPLNEGLVSIIGGNGTGKTAVLDLIAYATKSYRCYEKDEIKSKSFLRRAYKELNNTKIKVEWAEGGSDEIIIADKLEEAVKDGKMRYLPQDFIDQLCSEIGKNELEEQIENVIFQKIAPEDKASFTDFKSFKEAQLRVINDKKDRLVKQIEKINLEIYKNNELIKSKDTKKEEIKKTESQIKKYEQEMKNISDSLKASDEQMGILKDLRSLTDKKSHIEKAISELKIKIQKIEEIKNEIDKFSEDSKVFIKKLKTDFEEVEFTQEDIREIKIVLYPENIKEILDIRKKEINDTREKHKGELNGINEKIKSLDSRITLEKSKQDKIKEINKSLSELNNKKDSLNSDIERIKKAEEELKKLLEKRKTLFVNYFELIFEENKVLKQIYQPLESMLKKSAEENEKLFDFTVKFNFDIETMAKEGDSLIDHSNKGRFIRSTWESLKIELERLKLNLDLNNEQLSSEDREFIVKFLEEIKKLFLQDTQGQFYTIESQLKKEYTEQNFDNWLYSTKYYSISYSIKFNGLELNNLSPGLKGVALLILFLELDKDDKRPILIDQPEENLDNRSVYITLVRYFRKAKKRRQVIIVTHNPNLVVNADSEQIIVANFDKSLERQVSRIFYVSGSLENTFKNDSADTILEKQGIREHVCEILEGGEEAFKKRENKYQIK